MNQLREQLQASLGTAYALERELGGGGMSRVFLAEETAFGRKVVVKVLPPELVAGVNVERFKREIVLAARLQHPHIVPVLAAGELDGIPYYTMPFVEGESLRARVARGPLPIVEIIGILRDVAKALTYAHERGVVHRDIKPDNVLLSGGSAVVTDFGIAKALSASRTDGAPRASGATLTQMGTSIGTPAYMAPEQAAADPGVDHRADLYSFGCLAYELVAGRPPFFGLTPQKMLAAHMGERPQAVTELRRDCPPVLAELVMRCLEKDADARPQRAADLVRVLEVATTSDASRGALPSVLLGGRASLPKALGAWAVAFLSVGLVARAAIVTIGLPDWVYPGALIIAGLGLPAILFTHFVHHTARQVLTTTPALTPGGTALPQGTLATIAMRASPHVSWRRTWMAGGLAAGSFAALVGALMVLRAFGIGPAASLFAAGALNADAPILVAQFRAVGDTGLGTVVGEAVRADLAQSSAITLFPASQVSAALRRMQKPATSTLDSATARELALREGIRAIVDGEIRTIGGAYFVTVRLVRADSGQELASFRATAKDAEALIPTIGELSRKLRGRIGESLRSVNASPPLEQVTTASLPALRKYVEANRAYERTGDFVTFRALMQEAIRIDTAFAMAYRRLGAITNNFGGQEAEAQRLMGLAYQHRDRLPDFERGMAEGTWFGTGPVQVADQRRAIAAYEAAITANPRSSFPYNNMGLAYERLGDWASAEAAFRRGIAADPRGSITIRGNHVDALTQMGKVAAAESGVAEMDSLFPQNPTAVFSRGMLQWSLGRRDSAIATLTRLPESFGEQRDFILAQIYFTSGRLAEGERLNRESRRAASARGASGAMLMEAMDRAWLEFWAREHAPRALQIADSALATLNVESLPQAERPYTTLAVFYAVAGQVGKARTFATARVRALEGARDPLAIAERNGALAAVALAERRRGDAIRALRTANIEFCRGCMDPLLAYVFDMDGQADSVRTVLERFTARHVRNPGDEAVFLPIAYKRLGELYEARGERQKAANAYSQFLDLWKHADPELQPKVREVKDRLQRLRKGQG